MPDYTTPMRSEAPRIHVIIVAVDIPNLTATGIDKKNQGPVTIDLTLTQGQMITYPRENEEWFLEKINETWVLGHKAGFGNEGLLRDSKPGDLVTITTGDYHLETGPVTITADVTIQGSLDLNGEFHYTGTGLLTLPDMQTGDITSDGNIEAQQMHCINDLLVGPINAYGDINTHDNDLLLGTGTATVGNLFCRQFNASQQVYANFGLYSTTGSFSGAISATRGTFTDVIYAQAGINCSQGIGTNTLNASNSIQANGNILALGNVNGAAVGASGNVNAGVHLTAGGNCYADNFQTQSAQGMFYGFGLNVTGPVDCNRVTSVRYRSTGADTALGFDQPSAAALITSWDGGFFRPLRCAVLSQMGSMRRIKENFHSIEEWLGKSAIDLVKDLEISAWNYNMDVVSWADDSTRFGLMIDELPEPLQIKSHAPSGEEDVSYDLQSMLNVALKAIQEQQEQIDKLTARIEVLETAAA